MILHRILDTPAEREAFIRSVIVGIISALAAVWIARRTKVV